MLMKRNMLLSAAALLLSTGAMAQVEDVTSKYITNPGFEDCTPLELTTPEEGEPYVNLVTDYSTPGGTDYAGQGWTITEQKTSCNAGVANYGKNVKYNAWGMVLLPEAGPEGTTGDRGLVFTGSPYGSTPITYRTAELSLPAGWYCITVPTYVYSGWQEETQVISELAFVADDGTVIKSEKNTFKCNVWDTDQLILQFPAAVKGHFVIGYPASFYVMVDDIKLEYENKVITVALEEAIVKAKAISKALYDSDADLTAAIQAAEAFVQNPTTQDAVQTQETLLMNAINTALENTFEPVDISEGLLPNYSFETGKTDPWQGADFTVATVSPYGARPNIDGDWYGYFGWSATSFQMEQTITGLPNGYYYVSAIIEGSEAVTLFGNSAEATATPLSNRDYSLIQTPVFEVNDGKITLGAKADAIFYIDNFRLIYCTDEDGLQQAVYDAVVAEAKAVLEAAENAIITGEERTAFETAINATEGTLSELIADIKAKMSAFVATKDSYQKFETSKVNAVSYTLEAYPYADPTIYDSIVKLITTIASSAADAEALAAQLDAACTALVDSHYRLDGVTDKVDYSNLLNEGTWTFDMLEADPEREGFFKQTDDFYNIGGPASGSMEQVVKGLPAGKYAFVCSSRGGYYTIGTLYADGESFGELAHTGMTSYVSGVGYVDNWKVEIYPFTKYDDADMTLKIGVEHTSTYAFYKPEFGVGNMQIFKVGDITEREETIDIERIVGQGYAAQQETVDLAQAKAFLGVDNLTTSMLRIINPDGTEISDYAPFDGWFDRDGVATTWSPNTYTNVKFFEAIPEGTYHICDMGGDLGAAVPAVGDKFACKWALKANDKTYIYNINITYVEAPEIELTISDKKVISYVAYQTDEPQYTEKIVTLTDEQVNTILSELEISSLDEADVYGYNPTTGELLSSYAAFDGWRDANGDFAMHSGTPTVPACVKYTDGKNFYCYNISGCDEQTIKTYWAVANGTKAMLVEIDFIYTEDVTAINSVRTQDGAATVFDLQGRRVAQPAKGLYIVDGKKMILK